MRSWHNGSAVKTQKRKPIAYSVCVTSRYPMFFKSLPTFFYLCIHTCICMYVVDVFLYRLNQDVFLEKVKLEQGLKEKQGTKIQISRKRTFQEVGNSKFFRLIWAQCEGIAVRSSVWLENLNKEEIIHIRGPKPSRLGQYKTIYKVLSL